MSLSEPEFVVVYNGNEVPFHVYSLAAFCQEHGLDYQKMKDVVRGRVKRHQGWHMDAARTERDLSRAREIADQLGE